jgi:hypothetical protein
MYVMTTWIYPTTTTVTIPTTTTAATATTTTQVPTTLQPKPPVKINIDVNQDVRNRAHARQPETTVQTTAVEEPTPEKAGAQDKAKSDEEEEASSLLIRNARNKAKADKEEAREDAVAATKEEAER